ncbi:hypothetical protein J437_LFUL011374, partial [Ladona fulva]
IFSFADLSLTSHRRPTTQSILEARYRRISSSTNILTRATFVNARWRSIFLHSSTMHLVWYLVALSAFVTLSLTYSTGAPPEACDDMIPQHHAEIQKSSTFPYGIKLSKNKISSGNKVEVTIFGKNGENFRGFFVQGRVGNKRFGQFDPAPNSKLVDCKGGIKDAITHSDSDLKDSVTVTWNSPKRLSERVVFWATVAANGSTYWVAEKSQPLSVV